MGSMRLRRGAAVVCAGAVALALLGSASGGGALPLPTTSADFAAKGTQPNDIVSGVYSFLSCQFCHADYNLATEPARWQGTMHRHAARDPLFQAAVTIANQDASFSGETCYRCHSPRAFLEGRVTGHPDGSMLDEYDRDEGITCHVCHRLADPVYDAGVDPEEDLPIVTALQNAGLLPESPGNAQMVYDPYDRRRGPFGFDPFVFEPPHAWIESPFHRSGDLCATCHDVSNPVFDRQPDGSYVLNGNGAQHPTQNTYHMFPEQRTYSEWLNSEFAAGGVDMGGRFGGNEPVVSTCQDCHMPAVTGFGCNPVFEPPMRDDVPYHAWAGANRWMIDVLLHLNGGQFDQATVDALNLAKTDVEYMIEAATDAALEQTGGELNVRLTNQCGHKLLTGYPEGRRIWINVKFLDGSNQVIAERGFYDDATAELTESDTKVYEVKHGLDSYMAGQTGLPAGPSFHLVLNNTIYKDNRIPPRGFTNAAFETIQSEPVEYAYDDGQYWDDTPYLVPPGAASAMVTVYYQTASKEYIEFLRDANTTDSKGQEMHDAWAATGKSAPIVMDEVSIPLGPYIAGDLDGNGTVNTTDLNLVLSTFGQSGFFRRTEGDADLNGIVDTVDLNIVLSTFGQSLP